MYKRRVFYDLFRKVNMRTANFFLKRKIEAISGFGGLIVRFIFPLFFAPLAQQQNKII
jgi:hypothetical protein